MTVRKKLPVRFVDVFTHTPLSGNPLAVVLGADVLDDSEMQKIASEMNLSETSFVLPPTNPEANYRIRIFTPKSELPFAGHPVIGTAYILAEEGILQAGTERATFRQQLGIGVLPLEIYSENGRPRRVVMTQGEHQLGEPLRSNVTTEIAEALSLNTEDVRGDLPAQVSSTGIGSLMFPLKTRETLSAIIPDLTRLGQITRANGFGSVYAFVLAGESAHARLFAPELGIAEDPFTGSSAGALGAYLYHHSTLPIDDEEITLKVFQGDEMGRPGQADVRVRERDGRLETQVGGKAVTVLRGDIWV